MLDPTTVDTTDPDAVAMAVVATLYRYDTRIDTTPAAAARRAAPLLNSDLAAALMSDESRADSTWHDLERHAGHVFPDVAPANEIGQPANTDTDAYTQASLRLQLVGGGGWRRTVDARVVRVHLTRAGVGDQWIVDRFVG